MDGIQLLNLPQAAFGEIEGGQFAYIVTPDGVPFKVDISQLVGKMQQDAGCLCVQTAKLDIPSAEVLLLNTTPKAFGLNVPAGFYPQVLSAAMIAVYNSVTYATNITLRVRPIGASGGFQGQLNFPSSIYENLAADGARGNLPVTDWEVFVPSGNPTAGDSDITVYLTYVLVPL